MGAATMSKKERFPDVFVHNDIIGWLVTGWDDVDKGERQLHVDYGDLVNWVADQYLEGDKSAANCYVGSWDWLTMKDEIILLFIDKMSNHVESSKNRK